LREREREREFDSRSLGKKVFKSMEWPNEWRGRRPPFISPTGNLSVGVLEIRTCPIQGSNISGEGYWNPIWTPDKSGAQDLVREKSAGLDMSGSRTEYVRRMSLELGEQVGQVWPEDLVTEETSLEPSKRAGQVRLIEKTGREQILVGHVGFFWVAWFENRFSMIYISPTHSICPP
jgi:hypothetical protein